MSVFGQEPKRYSYYEQANYKTYDKYLKRERPERERYIKNQTFPYIVWVVL